MGGYLFLLLLVNFVSEFRLKCNVYIPHRKYQLKPYLHGFQLLVLLQAFINYSFSCKTVLGGHPCMWEIVHIKEQTCMLVIITSYGGRNCPKLVLKPLAAKNGLSISVLYIAPFLVDYTLSVYMMNTLHFCSLYTTYMIYLCGSATVFDKIK